MTRISLFVLLLSLPGIASAQVEEITPPEADPAPPAAPESAPPHEAAPSHEAAPPPSAPPPAAVPAPPAIRLTRYSRYRTSWYIGFGLGGGGGWVSTDSGGSSRSSDSRGGVALTILKVGWVAQPWLLIGFEGGAWRHDEDGYWVQFNHYDAVATFFPIFDRGLYGKVGAGAGVAVVGAGTYQGIDVSGRTDTGFDLKLGLGYEWQLLSSFNLGLDLSYAMTAYDEGRTHDLTAQLTFTWY